MWMTTKEAAEYLKIAEVTLQRWRRSGVRNAPPAHNIGSSDRPTWRYSREELDAWAKEQ